MWNDFFNATLKKARQRRALPVQYAVPMGLEMDLVLVLQRCRTFDARWKIKCEIQSKPKNWMGTESVADYVLENMEPPIPPPFIQEATRRKRQTTRVMVLVLCLCFFLFVLFVFLFPAILGASMFAWLVRENRVNFTSYTDKFHVTILEVKSEPSYFMERVRVQCEREMEAGIWVSDLKEAGLFETHGTNGEVFYREGHPHKAGQSAPIRSDGKFSTCEILFRVSTTSSNTVWHSEDASGTVDTTLPSPLTVSGVQTNWPASYERGSDIPLADLGDYKILLTVK